MYKVEDVAELLNLKPTTIRTWLKNGRLKGTKVGKSWIIKPENLRELFPEGAFHFNFDDEVTDVANNKKLHKELYPKEYQELYDMTERDPAGDIVEGWEKELDSKFPYPFKADEIAYWNNDKTNYLEGGDPDSYNIYYSLKLKDEQRKFDKFMEMLRDKYNVSEEDIGEIKSTSENIVILTCGQYIHPGF